MEDQVGQSHLPMLDPECVTNHFLFFAVWCDHDWCVCSFRYDRGGKRTASAARGTLLILPVSAACDQAHMLRNPSKEWLFWRLDSAALSTRKVKLECIFLSKSAVIREEHNTSWFYKHRFPFSSQMFFQQLIVHLSSLPWRCAMKREKKHLMKNKRLISNSKVGSDRYLTGVTVWHGPCLCYCASTAWCTLQYWETGSAVWWYQGRLGVHMRGFT